MWIVQVGRNSLFFIAERNDIAHFSPPLRLNAPSKLVHAISSFPSYYFDNAVDMDNQSTNAEIIVIDSDDDDL